MSRFESRILSAALLTAALAAPAAAQLPPPPPPLPDEIRPRVVVVAPPALRVETVVARPAPGYVWARGYWDWDGDSWTWVEGRWAVAPVRSGSLPRCVGAALDLVCAPPVLAKRGRTWPSDIR